MQAHRLIDLTDRVALITGGSRGIGAATAAMMAEAGADIAIIYRKDSKSALAVGDHVRRVGRKFLSLRADVSNFRSVQRAVAVVAGRFGKIDIVINNAGIWTYSEIGNMNERSLNQTLAVNLKGVFNVCNAVIPFMKKQGAGKIINVASTAGKRGEAFHSHYAASKGGVIALTKSLAAELAPSSIIVNCVSPGWVDTDMCAGAFTDRKYREQVRKSIPRGKIASPAEIAGPIVFLASDLASNVVGAVLSVNGGSVLNS
jgi:3-oxoacyl-[acyl-carrier protein] reductase